MINLTKSLETKLRLITDNRILATIMAVAMKQPTSPEAVKITIAAGYMTDTTTLSNKAIKLIKQIIELRKRHKLVDGRYVPNEK